MRHCNVSYFQNVNFVFNTVSLCCVNKCVLRTDLAICAKVRKAQLAAIPYRRQSTKHPPAREEDSKLLLLLPAPPPPRQRTQTPAKPIAQKEEQPGPDWTDPIGGRQSPARPQPGVGQTVAGTGVSAVLGRRSFSPAVGTWVPILSSVRQCVHARSTD